MLVRVVVENLYNEDYKIFMRKSFTELGVQVPQAPLAVESYRIDLGVHEEVVPEAWLLRVQDEMYPKYNLSVWAI